MHSTMTPYEIALDRLLHSTTSPKLGLERMARLLHVLGNPERAVPVLHVAGTNGKGSVCAYLRRTLECAGLSTGLYISPHLQCARERIQLHEKLISEDFFADLEQQVHAACQQLSESYTFFEQITAMAFLAFAQAKVKYAIVEVGLGGRLDATNCVQPIVCGITRIDLDHMAFLGPTLQHIAAEKAGIIKPGVPVVVAEQEKDVEQVITRIAQECHAPLHTAYPIEGLYPSLGGQHQHANAAVAWRMLDAAGLVPDIETRRQAFSTTVWPCRYEQIHASPDVLLDGAHNPAALVQLLRSLRSDSLYANRPMIAVVGLTSGHDAHEFTNTWRATGQWPHTVIATQSLAPRSQPASAVGEAFQAGHILPSVAQACEQAMQIAQTTDGYVLVTGSLYVAGEARALFVDMPRDAVLPLF